jgi:hypothetical protein
MGWLDKLLGRGKKAGEDEMGGSAMSDEGMGQGSGMGHEGSGMGHEGSSMEGEGQEGGSDRDREGM